MKEAIVLVGGLGTRLRGIVNQLPKAMAPVNGRPFLEYQLGYLESKGITRVIMAVGYMKEAIMENFGSSYRSLALDYAVEEEPLGTGGAIMNAVSHLRGEQFYILNGDTIFDIPLQKLQEIRNTKKADLVVALRKVKDTSRYGGVTVDDEGRINGFVEKGSASGEGWINGGIYLCSKEFLKNFNFNPKFSFEKEILEKEYSRRAIYGAGFINYFLDIGIPKDYKRAQHEFRELGY